jgi:hypothetical protein
VGAAIRLIEQITLVLGATAAPFQVRRTTMTERGSAGGSPQMHHRWRWSAMSVIGVIAGAAQCVCSYDTSPYGDGHTCFATTIARTTTERIVKQIGAMAKE